MTDSLHNLARSRERTRMVRRADGDATEAMSDGDSKLAQELAEVFAEKLTVLVSRRRSGIGGFRVRGAVLRQMTADYDREREAMEAQDAAAETESKGG